MRSNLLIFVGLVLSLLLVGFVLSQMSLKGVHWRWHVSASTQSKPPIGNVCIVHQPNGASQTCTDVQLFPGVYNSIGADQNRFTKWQDDYGFHSGGISPDGTFFVPEYPMLSRVAWTNIDAGYLQGSELVALLDEAKRVSKASGDPAVIDNLDKLSTIATEAQQRSLVLRFFG